MKAQRPFLRFHSVWIVVFGFNVLVASRSHADLVISIEGECPGILSLHWNGAVPNRNAGIAYSRVPGRWTMPGGGPCGGTTLGIKNPILVTIVQTGDDGRGHIDGYVPPGLCSIYLQMVVADGYPCQTSNVVQIQ